MAENELHEAVTVFRRFNRFYTKQIGLLNQGLLKTRFPLTQARILYELAQHEQSTPGDIISELKIDPGYLSRILSNFEKEGLLSKVRSKSDSRQRILKLTTQGKKSFSVLNERSGKEAEALLLGLSEEDRHRLLHAMQVIENILGMEQKPPMSYLLRPYEPGDIGWIVHRHGVVYSEEYGFDETFEALVAEILVHFIRKHDPKREYIWIAEQEGERAGSVMVVDTGDQFAQLRLLFVEPKARGKGIGMRLIKECINFSKRNHYQKIKLWTQSNLLEARHLYAKAGFELIEKYSHKSFGHDLIAEFWELPLHG
ncbi:MAG: MarR family transcriptional regulator [Desulfobacteraceae bacterium]|nr:MAG: MarR family transcriptional regulator [Desulfobacteraceae bacterium]